MTTKPRCLKTQIRSLQDIKTMSNIFMKQMKVLVGLLFLSWMDQNIKLLDFTKLIIKQQIKDWPFLFPIRHKILCLF